MDEKKLEIINRATTVFMRYGIKSITMDDLSRELGVSKKTIYKHFSDKNELVHATIEKSLQEERKNCEYCTANSENAIEALISISLSIVNHFQNINPTVIYDLRKYHSDTWKLINSYKMDFVLNNIKKNIERGIKEGLYRKNIKPEIISRVYVSTIELIFDNTIYPWPEFKLDTVLKEIRRFQIRGLASDKGIEYLNKKFNQEINE